MDRRESLKTLLITGMAGTTGGFVVGCEPPKKQEKVEIEQVEGLYGRTPEEKIVDLKIREMPSIFTPEELETIAILCDIILPATTTAGSATDAKVPEFIDYIVKEIPSYQLRLKGGLMWLDHEANARFNKVFRLLSNVEQIQIIDEIAYPDEALPAMKPGVAFFNRMRNLTLTGYYTTRMGFDDLGYKGNLPNVWDGVPEEVLKDHDVAYDPEWLAKCVDQSKRMVKAEWDEDGNLLT